MTSIFLSKGVDYLSEIVKKSTSFREIMNHFSYRAGGDSYSLLKKILNSNDINYSHFKNTSTFDKKPLEFYLTLNSHISSNQLKIKLIKANKLINKCSECGIENEYNSRPITLQLDHVNGDSTDNRLENLRILCPNCHSQTATWGGKKLKNKCPHCFKFIKNKSSCCIDCYKTIRKENPKDIFNISPENLQELIWQMPMTKVSKLLGCSDKTIAKKINKYNLNKPPRGYFLKK